MKIVRLQAHNIKRLVAVEIEPDGSLVKITGRNGEGKTSVLDAIWWALGGERVVQSEPIRRGERKASIALDLGELQVERRFTGKGSYLSVTGRDGMAIASPQKVLDKLVGALTFDPLSFMRMRAADQADELRTLAGIDTTQIEQDIREAFDARRDAKRYADRAAAAIQPTDEPKGERVDVAEVIAEIRRQEEIGREYRIARDAAETAAGKADAAIAKLDDAGLKMDEARANLAAAEEAMSDAVEAKHLAEANLAEAPRPNATNALEARLSSAEQVNRAHDAWEEHQRQRKAANSAKDEASAAADKLEELREKRQQMIADADMPIAGLSFTSEAVTLNGLPLDQCSLAEQLRTSVALAMAANPELRVIRITDASLLDSTSMGLLEEMATDHDFQIWAEVVDGSGEVGVYIEDGHVAAVNGEATEGEG